MGFRTSISRPARPDCAARLSAYLCERNTVTHNPVNGVEGPPAESYEGKTPALGDHQARQLLDAPEGVSVKGKRDRAILATLPYHALRCDEICQFKVKDFRQERRRVAHLRVAGKGGKTRYVQLHPAAGRLLVVYLEAIGHGADEAGALLRPLHHNRVKARRPPWSRLASIESRAGVLRSRALGFDTRVHGLRATAATNVLDHQADIAKAQEWLRHANIATTRIYILGLQAVRRWQRVMGA